jgi:hypothetical protein
VPSNLVKPGDEATWDKAKAAAKESYPDIDTDSERYWKIVTSIYKKMGHIEKARPFALALVLSKAYVTAHTRRLPSGRTITIPSYFTKRVAKGEGPKKQRAAKREAPPRGVHAPLRPEHLSARLVRHVEEGTLTHAEAHANLDHLERRAHAGHHLEHGHGPGWTPEQTHAFVAHARGKLYEHQQGQEREAQAKRIEELTGKQEEQAEQKPQEKQRPAQGITGQERQQAWDAQMREKQQAEREKGQGQGQGQEKPQGERETQSQQEEMPSRMVLLRRLQEAEDAQRRFRVGRSSMRGIHDPHEKRVRYLERLYHEAQDREKQQEQAERDKGQEKPQGEPPASRQALNYGNLADRMAEIRSGKAGLAVEEKLMRHFKVNTLEAAYQKVQAMGTTDEAKIRRLLGVIGLSLEGQRRVAGNEAAIRDRRQLESLAERETPQAEQQQTERERMQRERPSSQQASNYGALMQRMMEVSSGKAGLQIEQNLMRYFRVDTLAAAYRKVRELGVTDARKIGRLLRVLGPSLSGQAAKSLTVLVLRRVS